MRHLLRENWLVILVLTVMVGGYVFLRTPGDDLASAAAFDEQVRGGRPTLVEFFSNTCGACLMARPVVDGIERDLQGEIDVLRLGVASGVGRELAIRYGVRSVPTLVLLDGNGEVVFKQSGVPRRAQVVEAAEQLMR